MLVDVLAFGTRRRERDKERERESRSTVSLAEYRLEGSRRDVEDEEDQRKRSVEDAGC